MTKPVKQVPWQLTCPRCETVYLLGEDSTVYCKESLIATVGEANVTTLSDGSRPSRSDMVAKYNLENRTHSEALKESLRNLNLVQSSLIANEANRKWYCYACNEKGVKKEYEYPALLQDNNEQDRREKEECSALKQNNTAGTSSSKDGCFIATAACGSIDTPDVLILRDFRDRHLLRSPLGQKLIRQYYRLSPPVAQFIGRSHTMKVIVRYSIIRPMVFVAKLAKGWRIGHHR